MPDVPIHTFIGIDPGTRGAIAVIRNRHLMQYLPLKEVNRYDIRDFLDVQIPIAEETGGKVLACIERVRGFMGDETVEGVRTNKAAAHTMFVLGESYGALDMALVCCRITRKEVLPKEWQARYGMKRMRGETPAKWKSRLKDKAQILYPDVKMTLQISDAVLIAHHCSRLSWGA